MDTVDRLTEMANHHRQTAEHLEAAANQIREYADRRSNTSAPTSAVR